MNKLELGVQATATVADAAVPKPGGPSTNQGLVWNGSNWVSAFLVNANVDPAAAIAYSKLNLAGSVVNNDVATAAAIALSKLADPGAGNVVTSTGAGAVAAKPPGYEFAYNEFTAPVSVTPTTEGTAATVVTASAVTFDGSTVAQLELWCPYILPGTTNIYIEFFDGATGIGGILGITTAVGTPFGLRRRLTPSAATHTYSVKAWVPGGGTGSVGAGLGGAAVNLPGFIRITKV